MLRVMTGGGTVHATAVCRGAVRRAGSVLCGGPTRSTVVRVFVALWIALSMGAGVIGAQAQEMPGAANDGFFAEELHRPRITTDLRDEVYEYLSMWEDRGYITRPLPYLRPYPLQVIQAALEEVAERAPARHAERAEEFLRQMLGEPQIHLRGEHLSEFSNDGDYFGATGAAVQSAGYLLDNLSIAGRIGLYIIDENEVSDDVYPTTKRGHYDYMRDDSRLGALGREFLITPSVQGMSAIGNESTYFQLGLTRSTYGPFYDSGTILSQNAPHAGHFSFTHRSERFTYQHLMLAITATKDDGFARDRTFDGSSGEGVRPNKFLVLHGLTFHLFDWLDISLHESITYGQRFEPMYLIPTSILMYNQIITGEKDSAFIGFTVNARLPHDLAASTTFYLGDLGFRDLARGDLDTRYKFAWQTGGRWTPMRGMLERVSADYTMVLPYTYTHRRKPQGDDAVYDVGYDDQTVPAVNYQNYTHSGQSLVDMDPNSDRLRVQTRLRPNRFVTLNLHSAFLRHANATPDDAYEDEGGHDVGTSDGSVFDAGYRSEAGNLYDTWRFLSQEVIERIIQVGFDAEITFPVSVEWFTATRGHPGALTFDFGYTFEYGWNRRPRGEGEEVQLSTNDVDRLNRPTPVEGNDGARHYGRFGFSLAY